ncbi:MAG: hypothetical protein ACREIU_15905 [Planctomycetota bacterium]
MDRSLAASNAAVRAGRISRGVLATLVISLNCLAAWFMLFFACCGSPPISRRIGHPLFWTFVCAAVTALCAFPPISKRLRRTPARWACAPFVVGTFLFPLLSPAGLRDALAAPHAWGVVTPTGICALYVLLRVLLFPNGRRPAPPERGEALPGD